MLFVSLLAPPEPYDWTTDPKVLAWISVASVIIGVLGIALGYWFYRKGKKRHQIFFEVVSDTPIVSIREQIGKGKINVTYEKNDGQIVQYLV